MPIMPATFDELQLRLINDLALAHKFVHGLDTETIIVDSGEIPTLAKMAKDMPFAEKINAALQQAISAGLSADHAKTAAQNALNYKDSATISANAAVISAKTSADRAAEVVILKNQAAASASSAGAYAESLSATSTSSVAVGLGTKVFTIAAGKQLKVGQTVVAASGGNSLVGTISSYSDTTLTLSIAHIVGSGTFASWTISLTGMPGVAGARGTDGINGARGTDGINGAAGSRGTDGIAGARGTDGVAGAGGAYLDKLNVASGTVSFNQSAAQHQRLQVAGALTIATTGWTAGALGIMLLELVNAAAFVVTWPTIRWVLADGSYTTVFSSNTVTLQASGTDFVTLWSRDGGATVYGKIVR